MITWGAFEDERPDLAAAGRALLYQFGVGLAFLATTRADGGPRVHPMCPVLTDRALYAFIVPSPKRADLHRDGRYAMHSFPADDNEDAFSVSGTATLVGDTGRVATMAAQYSSERAMTGPPEALDSWELFEFLLERALLTTTTGHGDPSPHHTSWRADR